MVNAKERFLNDDRIKTIFQLIRETSAADLSTEYLANSICMSSSRLRAFFKACTGFPLHQYILRHKILTAITEIINGRSIQDAGYIAGFNDSSHFNKMLKKRVNVKPSQVLKDNSYSREADKSKFIFKTELAAS